MTNDAQQTQATQSDPALSQVTTPHAQTKQERQEHHFKYPSKYDEIAIILYLISLEVTNLVKEIRAKSPQSSRQLHPGAVFTPEQIAEARKNVTGFLKRAIATLAKRQVALNKTMMRLEQLNTLRAEIEDGMTAAIQNPQIADAKEIEYLEETLHMLNEKEEELFNIEVTLKSMATELNQLIVKHSSEWQQHQTQYATQLIAELEQHGIALSELEKQELCSITKTLDEVKQSLVKYKLLKESKK